MSKLQWQAGRSEDLSQLLATAELHQSAAIGTATLYHFEQYGRENIAVTLPDGQTLLITCSTDAPRRRRRIDSVVPPT